ncbi:MAG TPA: VOC family protein [Thermoanaerobaculia bacterium]
MHTAHVGINVTNLERSRDFYSAVLNLTTLRESADSTRRFAFLGHDGHLVLTLWEQSTSPFDTHAAGLHHLSFEVPSLEDVRAAEARLHARGATFAYDGIVPHAEGASSGGIFFTDPDGTRLEMYAKDGVAGTAPHSDAPTCGFF